MWADLERKLPAAVRNVSHSVYLCSDCWQNLKPVHNTTCFSLALVSQHSSCFSKEVMFLSSFSNSLIPAPPDQPFYTNKIIKLSLSLFSERLVGGCCFCSPLLMPRVSFTPFLSASLLFNLIHLILRRKYCHASVAICRNHSQLYFPNLFFSSLLLNKYTDITLRYQRHPLILYTYVYTHIMFRTFKLLANSRLTFLLLICSPQIS